MNYEVDVWIDDPWKSKLVRSALNEAIWWALKGAGIVIAFPQLDLHFDKNFGQPDGFNKQEPEH
jgi:small-conductance mechanosensitive channel